MKSMVVVLESMTREQLLALAEVRGRQDGEALRLRSRALDICRAALVRAGLRGYMDIGALYANAVWWSCQRHQPQVDSMGTGLVMTAAQELVIGLMAYRMVERTSYFALAMPWSEVLPWVTEPSELSPKRIMAELESAGQPRTVMPPARSRTEARSVPKPGGGRRAAAAPPTPPTTGGGRRRSQRPSVAPDAPTDEDVAAARRVTDDADQEGSAGKPESDLPKSPFTLNL